jgi:hypothetical protein
MSGVRMSTRAEKCTPNPITIEPELSCLYFSEGCILLLREDM